MIETRLKEINLLCKGNTIFNISIDHVLDHVPMCRPNSFAYDDLCCEDDRGERKVASDC